MYCMVSNFHGAKFSWIGQKRDFCRQNFLQWWACSSRTQTFKNFMGKIFMDAVQSAKTAKIFTHNNYLLYSSFMGAILTHLYSCDKSSCCFIGKSISSYSSKSVLFIKFFVIISDWSSVIECQWSTCWDPLPIHYSLTQCNPWNPSTFEIFFTDAACFKQASNISLKIFTPWAFSSVLRFFKSVLYHFQWKNWWYKCCKLILYICK